MAQDEYDPHPRPVPPPELLRTMEAMHAAWPPAPREKTRNDTRNDSGPAPAGSAQRNSSGDPATFDHAGALREYLCLLDDGIKYALGDRYDKVAAMALAPRLIKSSLDVAGWLKQMSGAMDERGADRRFTQRIIVEHVGPRPVPAQILKTIPGGATPAEPQEVEDVTAEA